MKRLAIIGAALLVALTVLYGGYRGYLMWESGRRFALEADTISTPTVEGQRAYVAADGTGNPQPLMLFMHGHGSDHEALTLGRTHEFAQELLDAGWIVAASDAHGNAWGSEQSQDDYVALADYISGEREVSEVVIVSESMGAIAGLNLATSGRVDGLAGWHGITPVIDLGAAADSGPLVEAIGRDVRSSQVGEVDPAGLDGFDVPLSLVVADGDKVIPAAGAEAFADRTGAALAMCEGDHGSPDCYSAQDVMALVGR